MATKPPATEHGPKVTDALHSIEFAKAKLVEEIGKKNSSAKRINDYVLDLAEAEGRLEVAWYEDWIDQEAAKQEVIRRLMNGADDTWSGRGNDVNRAKFDGFRKAAQKFLRGW